MARRHRAALSILSLIFLAALLVTGTGPVGAGVGSTPMRTRDLGAVSVGCDRVTFIASLNHDDDNRNETQDRNESLPLMRRNQPVEEDNLRGFTFDAPGHKSVYIAEVAQIPTNEIVVGTKVRAYEDAQGTPFVFGMHDTPVTMYLEGKQASSSANDIGFEFQFFKQDDSAGCGAFAQGTIVRAEGQFRVDSGAGAAFSRNRKMLITGAARGVGTATPGGLVTPAWTYDPGGATFSAPDALTTDFTAPSAFTPADQIGNHHARLKLTGTAVTGVQEIELHLPVNLTGPRRVRLTSPRQRIDVTTDWLDAGAGRMDLIATRIRYDLLDQTDEKINQSAYAGRMPQIRENIGSVLTSPIDAVRAWIDSDLRHSPDWKNKPDGDFIDNVSIRGMPKNLIVVTEQGRRSFEPSLRTVGGIVMHVPDGSTHIWELSVNGNEIVQATQNTFSSTVADVRRQAREIKIQSVYVVVLP